MQTKDHILSITCIALGILIGWLIWHGEAIIMEPDITTIEGSYQKLNSLPSPVIVINGYTAIGGEKTIVRDGSSSVYSLFLGTKFAKGEKIK